MASADICSSAISPDVYAAITQSTCSSLSSAPSRLARITSTASKTFPMLGVSQPGPPVRPR